MTITNTNTAADCPQQTDIAAESLIKPFAGTVGLEAWSDQYRWVADNCGGFELYWFDAAVGGISDTGEMVQAVTYTESREIGAASNQADPDTAAAWLCQRVEAARHNSNTLGESGAGHPLPAGAAQPAAAEEREWIDAPDGWQAYRRADGAVVVDQIEADDHLVEVSYTVTFDPRVGWWSVDAVNAAGLSVSVSLLDAFTCASPESMVEAVANLGSPTAQFEKGCPVDG